MLEFQRLAWHVSRRHLCLYDRWRVPVSLEGGGRALIGAFAGTGRNAQEFDGSITEAESDVALAGVYAAYREI
jgi:hypothetical protein